MNVIYSESAKRSAEAYARLQQATKWLEEVIGSPAAAVTAEWDRTEGSQGRTLFTLRISDRADSATASFAPEELASATYMQLRFYSIWGHLLQARHHNQLRELLGTSSAES